MASQLFGKEAKRINARTSSSNSISTEDYWSAIVLSSFKCCAIGVPFAFFRLNNFFIRCTLLLANDFLYIPDKVFIKSTMVFSFTTLCATDLDKVNRITPNTYLSRRFHSSSFIVLGFFPKKRQIQFLPIEIIFNLHPPIPKVYSIKLLNSWSLAFFYGHYFYWNLSSNTTC